MPDNTSSSSAEPGAEKWNSIFERVQKLEKQVAELQTQLAEKIRVGDTIRLLSSNYDKHYVRHSDYVLRIDTSQSGGNFQGDSHWVIQR